MADDLNFLEKQALEWANKVVVLYKTPVPPALQGVKNDLLKRAEMIKGVLETFFKNAPWLAELNRLTPASELGFVVVPLAFVGVAAAAAYIAKWTFDYNKIMAFRDDRDSYIASGMSPEQAVNLAAKNYTATTAGSSLFNISLPNAGLILAALIGGYFLLKQKRS